VPLRLLFSLLKLLKVRDWGLCVAFALILGLPATLSLARRAGTLALGQTRLPDGGQAWHWKFDVWY